MEQQQAAPRNENDIKKDCAERFMALGQIQFNLRHLQNECDQVMEQLRQLNNELYQLNASQQGDQK